MTDLIRQIDALAAQPNEERYRAFWLALDAFVGPQPTDDRCEDALVLLRTMRVRVGADAMRALPYPTTRDGYPDLMLRLTPHMLRTGLMEENRPLLPTEEFLAAFAVLQQGFIARHGDIL